MIHVSGFGSSGDSCPHPTPPPSPAAASLPPFPSGLLYRISSWEGGGGSFPWVTRSRLGDCLHCLLFPLKTGPSTWMHPETQTGQSRLEGELLYENQTFCCLFIPCPGPYFSLPHRAVAITPGLPLRRPPQGIPPWPLKISLLWCSLFPNVSRLRLSRTPSCTCFASSGLTVNPTGDPAKTWAGDPSWPHYLQRL